MKAVDAEQYNFLQIEEGPGAANAPGKEKEDRRGIRPPPRRECERRKAGNPPRDLDSSPSFRVGLANSIPETSRHGAGRVTGMPAGDLPLLIRVLLR